MTLEPIKAALANGWGKVIIGSLITAVVTSSIWAAGFFLTFGGVSKQVEVNTKVLNTHIENDSPISAKEHYDLKDRVGVCETKVDNQQKDIDEIKKHSDEMLRILRAWDNKRRGP